MSDTEDTRSAYSSRYQRSLSRPALNGSIATSGRYPTSETGSFATSMGKFDTCILGRQIVEPQKKHTVWHEINVLTYILLKLP